MKIWVLRCTLIEIFRGTIFLKLLCDIEQVSSTLWDLVFSSVQQGVAWTPPFPEPQGLAYHAFLCINVTSSSLSLHVSQVLRRNRTSVHVYAKLTSRSWLKSDSCRAAPRAGNSASSYFNTFVCWLSIVYTWWVLLLIIEFSLLLLLMLNFCFDVRHLWSSHFGVLDFAVFL